MPRTARTHDAFRRRGHVMWAQWEGRRDENIHTIDSAIQHRSFRSSMATSRARYHNIFRFITTTSATMVRFLADYQGARHTLGILLAVTSSVDSPAKLTRSFRMFRAPSCNLARLATPLGLHISFSARRNLPSSSCPSRPAPPSSSASGARACWGRPSSSQPLPPCSPLSAQPGRCMPGPRRAAA